MSVGFSLHYDDWLRGWREWARTRKRGKMAQFIVEKLEEGNQAQWIDIENGLFELTEWHSIAKEWFGEKPRNSEEVDAPCMLRKGLPRAFPGLDEIKEKSRKEGTQYRSRVFKAPQSLMNDVLLHITNNAGPYLQNGRDQLMPSYSPYPNPVFNVSGTTESAAVTTVPTYFGGNSHHHQMVESVFTNPTTNVEMDMQHSNTEYNRFVGNNYESPNYMTQQGPYTNDDIDRYVQRITENGSDGTNSTTSTNYNPASNASTTNGLYNNYTSPASMLGVPSPVGFQPKEEMGSPASGPPPYSTSPASTHSPRISPEPSMIGSYPPSVQQPNIISVSEMSPSAQISTSPAIPIEPDAPLSDSQTASILQIIYSVIKQTSESSVCTAPSGYMVSSAEYPELLHA